jgi:hypothetical protein
MTTLTIEQYNDRPMLFLDGKVMRTLQLEMIPQLIPAWEAEGYKVINRL